MQFSIPHSEIVFEIPDAWLRQGNAVGFSPTMSAYLFERDPEWPNVVAPFSDVEPPVRNRDVLGLHEDRTVSLLRAITAGHAVPAVEADEPPNPKSHRYRVRNGYHRFYISAALGFSHVPLSVKPYFDINAS